VAETETKAEPKTTRTRKPPRRRQVEDAARSYMAAVTARDPDAMAEHWHPDGVEDIVPLGVFRGPDGVRGLFRELFAAIPDSDMQVTRVTASETVAAVEWRFSGHFTGGPFQGIEPTGRLIELRGCDCLEIEDGKITRNTAFYDGMAFARGVGLMPPEDSGAERAMKQAFNAVTKVRKAIAERRPS
jgi:steroid delta-isomerase-like uncharacterized protein